MHAITKEKMLISLKQVLTILDGCFQIKVQQLQTAFWPYAWQSNDFKFDSIFTSKSNKHNLLWSGLYVLFSHLTWSSHVHLILYTWFPSHKTFFCFPWSLELLCNNFVPAWSMSSEEGASYLTIVFFLVFNFFTPSPVYISIHALIFFTFVKGYSIIAESSYFKTF